MRRLSSQDSLMPICPSDTHGHGDEKSAYPSMMMEGMDDEECGEEMCSVGQGSKKRRLSAEQVRALDKNFEVENKLDPERKVRLAHELGLQPRQVAVWFQNRRARWKTKQLERDYAALKSTYNSLRLDFESLQHHNQSLLAEIKELKAKLGEEESYASGKEDAVASESDVKASDAEADEPPALIYGPSDSDSSAVLNDDASRYRHPLMLDDTAGAPSSGFQFWTSSCNAAAAAGSGGGVAPVFSFQHQLMKAEEHSYEEPCSSFFADEQPPSLPWCYQDQWSWANGGGDSKISGSEGSF